MVKSVYIMTLNKKSINMEEYYKELQNVPLAVFSKHLKRKAKCRVCLQDGDSPITSVPNPDDFKEVLNVFGIVFDDLDSDKAAYLCYVCYKFLKSAILFRKVVQRSNETLNQPLLKQSPEHYFDYNYSETFDDDTSNQIYSKDVDDGQELEDEDEKVQCRTCKKILTKRYYSTHVKIHDPNFRQQYVCDICGKAFNMRNSLESHRRRHETRLLFKCQYCPYAGRYKERLSMHMRVHTGELKFLCTQCPARYINKGSLSDHIKFKHTEPQFKCDTCPKAYHNSLNLQRHIDAVHLGIKKHQCDICGSAFGYRRKMLEHQRLVHKRASMKYRYTKATSKTNMNE